MNKAIILILSIIILFSCKKDRLSGDREKFVGKWRWVKTEYQFSLSSPFTIYDAPSISGNNYFIEFKKCGKFYFLLESVTQIKSKTNFGTDKYCGYSSPCTHIIYLIDNENQQLNAYLMSDDSMVITTYPYDMYTDNDGYIKNYKNIYVRE